ncbi:MAG: YraN family protein, partial [Deltaproteobacteria bacterium]|nr:YraN family protein [Deltaproteobacteria bacterium]
MTAKHDKGRLAEELVVRALLRDGYDVLEQNVRVGRLELDIIARRGEVLAVIEVRTRGSGSWGTALE